MCHLAGQGGLFYSHQRFSLGQESAQGRVHLYGISPSVADSMGEGAQGDEPTSEARTQERFMSNAVENISATLRERSAWLDRRP